MRGLSRTEVMRKSVELLVLAAIAATLVFGFFHYEDIIDIVMDLVGLESINIMHPRLLLA